MYYTDSNSFSDVDSLLSNADVNPDSQSIIFERLHEFEDNANSLPAISLPSDVSLHNKNRVLSIFEQNQSTNHLMLVSLLEHICTLYAGNEETSSILFKVLCGKLTSLQLLPEVSYLDEFKAIRSKYQTALTDLVVGAMEAVNMHEKPSLSPEKVWQLQNSSLSTSLAFRSWYRDMFQCETDVGRGGFGKVIKAKNKLDQKFYAIKKVLLMESEPELCLKTLREVQVFSELDHPNVVRYHSSWLEYGAMDSINKEDDVSTRKSTRTNREVNPARTCTNVYLKKHLHGTFGACSNWNRHIKKISNGSNNKTTEQLNGKCEKHLITTDQSLSIKKLEVNNILPSTKNMAVLKKHPLAHCSFSNANSPYDFQNLEEVKFCCGISDTALHEKASCEKAPNMILYIQMELCHTNLRTWLKNRNEHTKYIHSRSCFTIFEQTLRGVNYIHGRSLMHRDLKPANIFVNCTKDDIISVKIGDFGLARYNSNPKTPVSEEDKDPFVFSNEQSSFRWLSQTRGVGTATYAAPEQRSSHDYTNKVDIYSLGIILFELFQSFETEMERVDRIKSLVMDRRFTAEFEKQWKAICSIILQMTVQDADDRPSASELMKMKLFTEAKNYNEADLHEELQRTKEEIVFLKSLLSKYKQLSCSTCKLLFTDEFT